MHTSLFLSLKIFFCFYTVLLHFQIKPGLSMDFYISGNFLLKKKKEQPYILCKIMKALFK